MQTFNMAAEMGHAEKCDAASRARVFCEASRSNNDSTSAPPALRRVSCSEASTCTGGGDASLSEASELDSHVPTSSMKQRLIRDIQQKFQRQARPGRKLTPPRSNPRAR